MEPDDRKWIGKKRLPAAQATKADFDRAIGRAADGHAEISYQVSGRDWEGDGSSLAKILQLQDFDQIRRLDVKITSPKGHVLDIKLGGRRPSFSWRGGDGADRGQAFLRDWRDLAGRAWTPWLIVVFLRGLGIVMPALAWLVAARSGILDANHGALTVLLIVGSVSALVFVGTSLGRTATFRAARAVSRPFVSTLERSVLRDALLLWGTLVFPALSLIVAIWAAGAAR